MVRDRLFAVIAGLTCFAQQYRALPCLAFTHFQAPADDGAQAGLPLGLCSCRIGKKVDWARPEGPSHHVGDGHGDCRRGAGVKVVIGSGLDHDRCAANRLHQVRGRAPRANSAAATAVVPLLDGGHLSPACIGMANRRPGLPVNHPKPSVQLLGKTGVVYIAPAWVGGKRSQSTSCVHTRLHVIKYRLISSCTFPGARWLATIASGLSSRIAKGDRISLGCSFPDN